MAQFQFNRYTIDVNTSAAKPTVEVTGTEQPFEIITDGVGFFADPQGFELPLANGDAQTRPGMGLVWEAANGVRFDLMFERLDINTSATLGLVWPFTNNAAHYNSWPTSAEVSLEGITSGGPPGYHVYRASKFAAITAPTAPGAVKYTIRATRANQTAVLDPVIIIEH